MLDVLRAEGLPLAFEDELGVPMCCLTRDTTRCGSTFADSLAVFPTMILEPSKSTTEGVIRSLS